MLAYPNGKAARLADTGAVRDGVENDKTAAWLGNERSVMLAIQKQPGTNTVEVARAARQLLPTFEQQLPASVATSTMVGR